MNVVFQFSSVVSACRCVQCCVIEFILGVYFIIVSWDASVHPAHCTLCPSHRYPFSAQVGLDYLQPEAAHLERGEIESVLHQLLNRVSYGTMTLSAKTPLHAHFIYTILVRVWTVS